MILEKLNSEKFNTLEKDEMQLIIGAGFKSRCTHGTCDGGDVCTETTSDNADGTSCTQLAANDVLNDIE